MRCSNLKRAATGSVSFVCGLAVAAVAALFCSPCSAGDMGDDPPPPYQPSVEMRSGGVLEESYYYHRQPPMYEAPSPPPSPSGRGSCIVPAIGWYGYGFPVSTFRWGWFGAAHYYPFVWWHDGYYGDCCRYAYRRGY